MTQTVSFPVTLATVSASASSAAMLLVQINIVRRLVISARVPPTRAKSAMDDAHQPQPAQSQRLRVQWDGLAKQFDGERRAGQQLVDVPVDRRQLHLRAHDRDEIARPEQAEVMVTQRGQPRRSGSHGYAITRPCTCTATGWPMAKL